MALKIEKGARFEVRGSDSEIEVLSYSPGASVTYQVVGPIPTAQPMKLTEDEFRAYVIDPETGLTESETAASHERVFKEEMVGVNMQHVKNLQEVEDERTGLEADASQRALDRRDEAVRQTQDRREADQGVREELTGANEGDDTQQGKSKKGKKGQHQEQADQLNDVA